MDFKMSECTGFYAGLGEAECMGWDHIDTVKLFACLDGDAVRLYYPYLDLKKLRVKLKLIIIYAIMLNHHADYNSNFNKIIIVFGRAEKYNDGVYVIGLA